MAKYGYHDREIEKGTLGSISKIREEFEELMDAHGQGNKIMELCELADLIGAIEHYAASHYKLTLDDIIKMTRATQEAFQQGRRK